MHNQGHVKKLLRLADEEYLYFDEMQIHDALMKNTKEFLDTLKTFYIHWAKDDSLVDMPIYIR